MARFELSTQPEHSGAGRVVIRVLEILHPVEPLHPETYDGHKRAPKEGSLLYTTARNGQQQAFSPHPNSPIELLLSGEPEAHASLNC